jgi:hypothetical protein
MALPKLNTAPIFDEKVPSTGERISYRPYLVKEEKVLMMAFESRDQKQVTRAIGNTLNSCIQSDIDVFNLTTFDVEYLFTKIRSKAVGERSTVIMNCSECKTGNEVDVMIDELQLDVSNTDENGREKIQITDDIAVELAYPAFGDILDVETKGDSIEDGIGMVASSIQAILTEEERFDKSDVKPEEIMDFIMELPTDKFNLLGNFLRKIPKIQKDVSFDCTNCSHHNEYTLEGMKDFLV